MRNVSEFVVGAILLAGAWFLFLYFFSILGYTILETAGP
jgi:hypothetical protein